jgi:hypothetical protein
MRSVSKFLLGCTTAISLVALSVSNIQAQNIGINTVTPDASSILDITHTTRGLLIPRIVLTATNVAAPVVAPATSLLVYNTNTTVGVNGVMPGYYYWDGLQWASLSTPPPTTNTLTNATNTITSTVDGVVATALAVNTVSNTSSANNLTTTVNGVAGTTVPIVNSLSNTYNTTTGAFNTTVNGIAGANVTLPTPQSIKDSVTNNAWLLKGNTGTTASTNFVGTTDNQDLVFKRNSINAGLLNSASFNTAFGVNTFGTTISGSSNTGIGYNALLSLGLGSANTATGQGALANNIIGNINTAIGYITLTNTTGGGNTGLGGNTGTVNTTGNNNTFIGSGADATLGTLTKSTAIGYNSKVGASNSLILGGTGADAVNVGIGTTTPATKLHVVDNYNGQTRLTLENNTNAANALPMFFLQGETAFDYGYLGLNSNSTSSIGILTDQLVLSTGSAVTNGLKLITQSQNISLATNLTADAVTILPNNNVGIGTVAPATKLHVLDGQITQEFSTNTSHSILMKNPSGRNWQLYHLSPTDGSAPNGFMFEHFDGTAWQRYMTIAQTGNVGIGNSAPIAKLDIAGISSVLPLTKLSDAQGITLRGNHANLDYNGLTYTSGGGGGAGLVFSRGGTYDTYVSFYTNAATNLTAEAMTERMRISDIGNVGIGTNNPTEKLDIVGSIKIADGSEGAGKVLTSDATGKGTWQSPSALANYPYQNIGNLPVGASCASGGSYFTSTINLPAGIYNFIHYSCDGQIGAATSGHYVVIEIVSGSGDATATYHNFINGSVGCNNYYTGVLRCYTACTVRKRYDSYVGSTFSVPGANSENTTFIKIL